MPRKKHQIKVQVAGGLGNQLFGLAAGLYVSTKSGIPVSLDLSQIDKGVTAHGVSLTELSMPSGVNTYIETLTRNLMVATLDNLTRHLGSLGKSSSIAFGSYTSHTAGYDPVLNQINKPISLRGYFQTYKFAEFVESEFPGIWNDVIQPNHPSNWYLAMKKQVEAESSVAVHVRRGDYRRFAQSLGLLSSEYYASAIDQALNVSGGRRIWVFSDEINLAKAVVPSDKRAEFHYVEPPSNESPVSTLALMSLASGHVISNSTFAWWAAYASRTSRIVVAPEKWFKSSTAPNQLRLPSWHALPSTFE